MGWLKLLLENMVLQLKNHKPLDDTILHDIAVKLQETQQYTKKLDQSDTAAKLLQSTILRDMNRYDDDTNDYDPKEQAKAIGDTYDSYANAAADSQKDAEVVSKTVDELLDAANQAEGDMQIQQIKSQLSGLEESEKARQNALLAQLRAIDQKIQTNDDLAYYRQVRDAELHVQDPYHPTEREKQQYQQPEGRGWVEFK